MDNYPEHTKLSATTEQRQSIGDFLNWLQNEQNVTLAAYSPNPRTPDKMYAVDSTIQDWLALYFDIDLTQLEAEKRTMLQKLRSTD